MSKRLTVYLCDGCNREYDSAKEADQCARDDKRGRKREHFEATLRGIEDDRQLIPKEAP